MKRLLLAFALLACRSTTAPEPVVPRCRVYWPTQGTAISDMCYTPCPPGTKAWAQGAGMGYTEFCASWLP